MIVLRALAVALWIGLSGCAHSAPPSAQPADTGQAYDPSLLVVVHSWTGRTATAGREIAAILGAKMLLANDAFGRTDAPAMEALSKSLSEGKVRRLYLGFPVWNEAPSSPVQHFVENAPLSGVTVIPFYTYLHYIDPATLAGLAETIRARGGIPVAPLALRVPLSFTDAQITCLARRALLDEVAAWPWPKEPMPTEQCTPEPAGGQLCHVPAGSVWLGDTSTDCVGPSPLAVRVEAFGIDQAEVSIGEYSRCVEAGTCPQPQVSSGVSHDLVASGNTRLPMPGVSYAAARAYCAWRGMRLPTEAEWMRSGRGDGTTPYPWGTQIDAAPLRGNFGDQPGLGLPHYSLATADWPADGITGLAPGCSFAGGRSPFGVCDLAGNLAEWVARVDDPNGDQPVQILKGGSWLDAEPTALRLSSRAPMPVELGGFYLSGFRCARSESAKPQDSPSGS